ncbi:histidine kinase [Cohnella rhizosphaerae]|uniref:Histidine kinase n=1 Tax=Cohnella rhizosphaerae TaxID=1457232 RepID=A0A9X4QWB5_9BACL|nr:histidine kinase [Cohnella rhizosphaerae]MDG0813494.1 histidine kinase [Cohnella rhizosphaerae]
MFVIGAEGEQVLRSDDSEPASFDPNDVMEAFANGDARYMKYKADNRSYMAFYRPMENTGWNIIAMIPESIVNRETATVRNVMAVILAAILLLGISALAGFQYTIIRPILRLKNEANRVKLGDFTARVPIGSNDEISELNRKFNEMVLTIQELIEHKYKLELRERESELRLLQNQMDPHFLYNTLDMIRWTARLEKAGKTSQLIEMLSKFFRLAPSNGNYVTTVQQELEFVQSYLYLQERRLGQTFRYSLFMDASIAAAPMLKTTIQPLVENFLKHGRNRGRAVNRITVKCYAVSKEIWLDVQDNGRGIEPGKLEAIRHALRRGRTDERSAGALSNIQERLSIYFGEGYGLEIVSSTPDGTLIRLKIPDRADGGEIEDGGNNRT